MIGIIDYGSGNIQAVQNIYKRLNVETFVLRAPDDLNRVTKFILPGVGAFDVAMSKLNESGLRVALDEAVLERKVPVMGICIGMQVMANSSEEGSLEGLGWIPGKVKRFDESKMVTVPKVPHMGWNVVSASEHPILRNIDNNFGFYFMHSYYFQADRRESVIASSFYTHDFDCAINIDNISGVQFHPEKSHRNGIQLFKNFSDLPRC